MRKTAIILSIAVLTASGCKQATSKQAEPENEAIIEQKDEKTEKAVEKVAEKNNEPETYLRSAEKFLNKLKNKEKLQLLFSANWTFIYHEDNRADGSTDGEKTDLSPSEIDAIIKLKVKNDGDGWFDKKGATDFILDFNLKEQVENWDRFEIPNWENQGKDGIVSIAGSGASDYIILHYDNNNLIIKMEYRSEDPG